MAMLLYLAYGSNLHPVRLTERVASARLLGSVELPGLRLAFHVRGGDDSGKGNLVACRGAPPAYGAVYEIAEEEKPVLDRYEGASYRDTALEVTLDGRRRTCFTYLGHDAHIDESLRPYDWYKHIILLGAQYLGAPAVYLDAITRVECMPDPDVTRSRLHGDLIKRMSVLEG